MTLPVDFVDAHRRHWADAELLFDHERLGNADQLYGFSAECGLKAVMTGLGMPLDPSGRPPASTRGTPTSSGLCSGGSRRAMVKGGTRSSLRPRIRFPTGRIMTGTPARDTLVVRKWVSTALELNKYD